jgi:hypothetical protein
MIMLSGKHDGGDIMKSDNNLSALYSEMGRRGAKARAKKLSAKRRREIAAGAAKARWGKKKRRPSKPKLKAKN